MRRLTRNPNMILDFIFDFALVGNFEKNYK
jgi:hypothetical protein